MKRILAMVIVLALCLSFATTALGAVKVSKAQKQRIEVVLDYYFDQQVNYYPDAENPAFTAFDVEAPNDEVMINMAVLTLYYGLGEEPSEKQGEFGDIWVFTEAQVNTMCEALFGVKPSKHAESGWEYKDGKYMITGDRGELIAPKVASVKTLKNGDVLVTLNARAYSEKGKIYNTGLKMLATLRPQKDGSVWDFTIQKIAFSGKVKIK